MQRTACNRRKTQSCASGARACEHSRCWGAESGPRRLPKPRGWTLLLLILMRMFRVAPCRDRLVHRERRDGSCWTFIRVGRFRVVGAGPCRRTRKGPTRIMHRKPHDTKHSPARTDRVRKISPPAPTRTDTSRHGTVWFVFHQIPRALVGSGDRNLVAMLLGFR